MTAREMQIYRFTNKINGKIYIGQTIVGLHKRVIQHLTSSRPHVKCWKGYFHNALNKYGIENFEIEILENCRDKEHLNIREIYWIGFYKSNDKKFGYNLTPGGDGNSSLILTKEHKQKLLLANLGKHRSKETKKAISKAHKHLWSDSEYRKKMMPRIKKSAQNRSIKIVQLDLNYNLIDIHNSLADVNILLYGERSAGNLTRNLKNNGMMGFKKNNCIWMYQSKFNERIGGDYRR